MKNNEKFTHAKLTHPVANTFGELHWDTKPQLLTVCRQYFFVRNFEPTLNVGHLLSHQSNRHHLIHRDQQICKNMIGRRPWQAVSAPNLASFTPAHLVPD